MTLHTPLLHLLEQLYPSDVADRVAQDILALVDHYKSRIAVRERPWVDETDVMLITYGDSMVDGETPPLQVLGSFLDQHVGDVIPNVHILPFFPFSSDDGFSVIDFLSVNETLGDWSDIADLARSHDLMFDGVFNHISQHSDWFQRFLQDDPDYAGYFLTCDPDTDLSQVTRPRTHPVLTPFETPSGVKHVWTTFSDDQVDLNFETPQVLVDLLTVLLEYAARGARFVRLDAIGFLWKSPGTSCIHLPQTHVLIQIMRQVLDMAAPGTLAITETNVPHLENVSYFGDGTNEAHMVYQFPLPPLVLHTMLSENTDKLMTWLESLAPTTPATTFFNFLASHDGIGVRAVESILSRDDVDAMSRHVRENGGRVSMRSLPDGTDSPYEMNISYLDAVSSPQDDDATRAAKFLAAHVILLSLAGVPGIYIQSLLGSRNDLEGLRRTGRNRSINRAKLQRNNLESEINTPDHLRQRIFEGLIKLLTLRRTREAFHPNAAQIVLPADAQVFAVLRQYVDDCVLCLVNVSAAPRNFEMSTATLGQTEGADLVDLITGERFTAPASSQSIPLSPYQCRWVVRGDRFA
jgi:sucrose phosphorylase